MIQYKKISIFVLLVIGFFAVSTGIVQADLLQDAQSDRARLESELAQLEKEIAQKQKELDGQKGQSASLSRDISILSTKIGKSKLDIQSKNLTIQKLGGEIIKKSSTIQELTEKIETEKETLAQLIRKNREIDDMPIIALLLSSEKISDMYGDVERFASIKKAIKNSVDQIKSVRGVTEQEKKNLEEKRNKENDVKAELENTKKEVEKDQANQKVLLSISKNKEVEYSNLLTQRKAEAAKIRARLFELAGGVQGGGIPFGDAVKYAEYASTKTGVRTAFILGILKQETNLGKNVGLCFLADASTGASKGINTGRIFENGMKATRDVGPFLTITANLGLDPYNTRVSCPLAGVAGYGGAMGPSQFIPSTWQMFASRIAKNFNVKYANPWNPEHAVMATAVYLQELGAGSGGYTAESNAACRYYSGVSCSHPTIKNAFYANAVLSHASKIEDDIKLINDN